MYAGRTLKLPARDNLREHRTQAERTQVWLWGIP